MSKWGHTLPIFARLNSLTKNFNKISFSLCSYIRHQIKMVNFFKNTAFRCGDLRIN